MNYTLEANLYGNGRPAIQVYDADDMPYCVLSTNIPSAVLEKDEVCIKDWDIPGDFLQEILSSGKFEDTCKRVPTGYVSAPVWKICCPELLREIAELSGKVC